MANDTVKIEEFLYHYTTIDALQYILPEIPREGEEICLISTDYEYLNDPHEVYYGCKVAAKFLPIIEEELNIPYKLRIGEKVISELSSIKDKFIFREFENEKKYYSLYMTSFSQAKDDLNMWSMYAENGNGIALEFRWILVFMTMAGTIRYVVYDNEEMKIRDILKSFYSSYTKGEQNIANILSYFARYIGSRVKNSCYAHEKEHKLCNVGGYDVFGKIPQKVNFRVKNNVLIPFHKVFYPKVALTKVIVGPTRNFEQTEKSIKMLLYARGISHVKVEQSSIPYRQ